MKIKKKFARAAQVLYPLVREYTNINPTKVNLHTLKYYDIVACQSQTTIWMNPKIDPVDIDWAMCHEFVHLKQYLEGRLIYLNNSVLFDGVHYPYTMPYELQPWEIEAYELQNFYLEKL